MAASSSPAASSTRATRAGRGSDVGPFDASALDPVTREALAELLLTLADDEFVIGFWDSEWTGIAPQLEEDVAFSSLAQDELGHARAFYELLAAVTGGDADTIAFGREPGDYRHCRLVDHARGDWAFSVARRWLYDTADAVRLAALAGGSFAPFAGLVGKIRREERYHLMHLDAWMGRLAADAGEPRRRLQVALDALWADALTPFSPLAGERALLDAGIFNTPLAELGTSWLDDIRTRLGALGMRVPPLLDGPPSDGRSVHGKDFRWLWGEFTSVYRSQPGASW